MKILIGTSGAKGIRFIIWIYAFAYRAGYHFQLLNRSL